MKYQKKSQQDNENDKEMTKEIYIYIQKKVKNLLIFYDEL